MPLRMVLMMHKYILVYDDKLFEIFFEAEDEPQALRNISRAINLEPFNGELRLLKTKIYLAFNRFEQALESLDEMEKVLPDSFDIYDVKSQILLGQERYTERLLKSTSN